MTYGAAGTTGCVGGGGVAGFCTMARIFFKSSPAMSGMAGGAATGGGAGADVDGGAADFLNK